MKFFLFMNLQIPKCRSPFKCYDVSPITSNELSPHGATIIGQVRHDAIAKHPNVFYGRKDEMFGSICSFVWDSVHAVSNMENVEACSDVTSIKQTYILR